MTGPEPARHQRPGLDAARACGLLPHAEVVLLTADVMPSTRDAAVRAGLRHFLSKPFQMAAFEALLDRVDAARAADVSLPANG